MLHKLASWLNFDAPAYTHELLIIGNLDDPQFVTLHVHDDRCDLFSHETLQKLAWDYRLSIESIEKAGECCPDEEGDLKLLWEAARRAAADDRHCKGCEGRAMRVLELFSKSRGADLGGVAAVPIYLITGSSPRPKNLVFKPSRFGWD